MLAMALILLATTLTSYTTSSARSNSRLLLQTPIQQEVVCEIPAGMTGSCAGSTISPANGVANEFKLYCQIATSCQGTTFYLYSYGARLTGAWFNELNSGNGATLNIGGMNQGIPTTMNLIECSAIGACVNMVVNLVNAEIHDFICTVEGSCDGCMIYDWKDPEAPIATPCMQIAKLVYL